MTPTVFREGSFRFFFLLTRGAEDARSRGSPRWWGEVGLADHVMNEAKHLVEEHVQEIIDAWHEHFSS